MTLAIALALTAWLPLCVGLLAPRPMSDGTGQTLYFTGISLTVTAIILWSITLP